jgi:phosphoribosylformimino-5-aminoimidazole carboxamide ribotide isomerase
MLVVPVIDLRCGQVVHAIGGERQRYEPIQSVLCAGSSPATVAQTFAERLRASCVYVADLAAIQGGEIQWSAIDAILAAGLNLWLDAGVRDGASAEQLRYELDRRGAKAASIVIGSETLTGVDELSTTRSQLKPDLALFSVDLKHGRPLVRGHGWPTSATGVAERAIAAGYRRLMLLDLAEVGHARGPWCEALVRDWKLRWPTVQIVSGGGIRNGDDLLALSRVGCDAALVGSALHQGTLPSLEIG